MLETIWIIWHVRTNRKSQSNCIETAYIITSNQQEKTYNLVMQLLKYS